MEKRMRNMMVTAAAVAGLSLAGGASSAAEGEPLTIVVHVTNHAGTPSADLARAQVEMQRIFDGIDVRAVWSDIAEGPNHRACEGLNLFVSLLSPYMSERLSAQGVGDSVLGSASVAGGRIFIHSKRVSERAARALVDESVLLGRVIAHEIGHMVLPGVGHTRTGIMVANIETDPTGLAARFTSDQARAIRARLEKAGRSEERASCGN